ncbi:hypothetical protein ACTD5D_16555 [Nocardia takedensis]|uniref:hypothetical protein n=1 Tax=Nocardia takedensis TaxID=259390 RepID=UPI000303F3BC|nr:hypothetical protein [Nocardia takedensis]
MREPLLGLLLITGQRPEDGYAGFLAALLVLSVGLGLAAAPATAAIMNDSPADNHGVSAAVNDAAREIGAAIGIAISGTVLASGYRAGIDPVLPRLPEPVRGPVSHSLAATTEFAAQAGPQADPVLDLARVAFVDGMHRAAIVLACISFAGAILLGVWAPGPRRRP